MAKKEFRDPSGRLLGYTQPSGQRIEGRDPGGRLKGYYDPRNNETRDPGGRLIGKGDMLFSLIVG